MQMNSSQSTAEPQANLSKRLNRISVDQCNLSQMSEQESQEIDNERESSGDDSN